MAKEKMHSKKILITISKDLYLSLLQIKEKRGHVTISETIRAGLGEYKVNQLDNYIEVAKKRQKRKKGDPVVTEQDMIRQGIRQKVRTDVKLTEFANICKELKGEITGEGHESVCRYKTYEELAGGTVDHMDREMPLELLTPDLVNTQYTDIAGETGEDAKRKIRGLLREQEQTQEGQEAEPAAVPNEEPTEA